MRPFFCRFGSTSTFSVPWPPGDRSTDRDEPASRSATVSVTTLRIGSAPVASSTIVMSS